MSPAETGLADDWALRLCRFKHLRAVHPEPERVSVSSVVERLSRAVQCPTREERARTVPLWSPVEYHPGTTRGSRNVWRVHWLVLDYDDGTDIDTARERWSGWVHIGHTTYSHMQGRPPTQEHPEGRPPAPALRVVLPLLEPVDAEVWPEVMRGILQGLGQDADRQCIDPARMFYVPVIASATAPFSHWVHLPSGDVDGPWLCLADEVEAAIGAREERAAEARARREAATARARDVTRDYDDQTREMRRRLMEDGAARERIGVALGGVRVERPTGAIMRGVMCPACNRPSVWWYVEPGDLRRARCNHRNSCGYQGLLWELAALLGLRGGQ